MKWILFGAIVVAGVLVFMPKSLASGNDDEWTRWDALIKKYARLYNVPWRWVKAIMIIESNLGRASSVAWGLEHPEDFAKSKSSDGKSVGLMQVTLPTARKYMPTITWAQLNDPDLNVKLGVKELQFLINYFGGLGAKEKIVRGYNGGPGWQKTNLGPSLTLVYWGKFQLALAEVMRRDPGDELSFS